eukprot:4832831-Amphidinium_carterae.4
MALHRPCSASCGQSANKILLTAAIRSEARPQEQYVILDRELSVFDDERPYCSEPLVVVHAHLSKSRPGRIAPVRVLLGEDGLQLVSGVAEDDEIVHVDHVHGNDAENWGHAVSLSPTLE